MSTPSNERAEILFYEALKRKAGARAFFLDEVCGSDHALRAEIEKLLRDDDAAGSFLNAGAPVSRALAHEFSRLKSEDVGDRIGDYKLLELLGEGGFGTVWVAEQERPVRRKVALKIIKLGMDTKEVIARFEQERQALAMMDHPNIARVLDSDATPTGRPFFVMDLVRGVKITEFCDEAKLPTVERLRLFVQVCNAVQHAHQKGIIHRDLKPSNILVTLHDGVPVPKVIDFGVAKAIQRQQLTDLTVYTQFEQMIGTPLYMSPEQAEMSGLDVDTRSDIYSLGVLLYELLTGRTPFDPKHLVQAGIDEVRRVIREQEPQKPSTFVSTMAADLRTRTAHYRGSEGAKLIQSIRGDLDWIVMKALEKDRSRRYPTANGLAQDIQRHLVSEPVQARPPSKTYRTRKFIRRNKVAFAAGSAIAASLLIGIVVSAQQAMRANRSEMEAKRETARANAALNDLRSTAPAFAAQARGLIGSERFDEAIEKLGYAIQLRPDTPEYLLSKADLLQSQFHFAEAESMYRRAGQLEPANSRVASNVALCAMLNVEYAAAGKLSRERLLMLFNAMKEERRSAAELVKTGRLLGEETNLRLAYWLERLKDLPIPPDRPLQKRLELNENGRLELDLSDTSVVDLTPLTPMPLDVLNLDQTKVSNLFPIREISLRKLSLAKTAVRDLSPLRTMSTLRDLNIAGCNIEELDALQGLRLESLSMQWTKVSDLSPLHDMPLRELVLAGTPVGDLSPLTAMPLEKLECISIPAEDFSPLVGLPIKVLSLQNTKIKDLQVLRGMPLQTLLLNGVASARGYKVLSELSHLEILTLPDTVQDFSAEEFDAIGALRKHPSLTRVQMGIGAVGSLLANVPPKAQFWKRFGDIELIRMVGNFVHEGKLADAEKLLIERGSKANNLRYPLELTILAGALGKKQIHQERADALFRKFILPRDQFWPESIVLVSHMLPESTVADCELDGMIALANGFPQTVPRRIGTRLARALKSYRAGEFQAACDTATDFKTDAFPAAGSLGSAIRALSRHQLGDTQGALADIKEGRTLEAVHTAMPQHFCSWHYWLLAAVLLNEAEQLTGITPVAGAVQVSQP